MQVMQLLNSWFAKSRKQRGNRASAYIPERRMHRRLNARQGTRVLIVDDSEKALSELAEMFLPSGYFMLQTQDPERGLFLACFEHPELVILDVGMPGMNGFEVLKRMRKDPVACRIPVILISGNPQAFEHFQRRRIDAEGFIRKPLTRRALFTRIEKLLDEDRVPRRKNAIRAVNEQSLLRRFRRLISS